MEDLIKQTYIFLSLEAAIEQLQLFDCSTHLHQILKPLIQQELQKVIKQAPKQSSNNESVLIDAKLVLDSQFPVGDSQIHKFQAVLYDLSINLEKIAFKHEEPNVSILQLYSGSLHQRKKAKDSSLPIAKKDKAGHQRSQKFNKASTKSKLQEEQGEYGTLKRQNQHFLSNKTKKFIKM